jgi:L,D-peptidoglycan transpeptidase YkuD (ErfK/YbiS/YcfS/YnhG family)
MSCDLVVTPDGAARLDGRILRCALGRGGVSAEKREGDGATPLGRWLCRSLLYRPDRIAVPPTGLTAIPLAPFDGWCDAPGDPAYNRPVRLPYAASCESLWREDHVYDLIVPLGYNDDPVIGGRGSAIFLHLARPGYAPTEGCVALALDDLMAFLARADAGSRVIILDGAET